MKADSDLSLLSLFLWEVGSPETEKCAMDTRKCSLVQREIHCQCEWSSFAKILARVGGPKELTLAPRTAVL